MPFSIRPFRRFPVSCSVTSHARPFQGHDEYAYVGCSPDDRVVASAAIAPRLFSPEMKAAHEAQEQNETKPANTQIQR